MRPLVLPAHPVRVVKRLKDDSRSQDRAYGYWFVRRTRTEYLFDRDYRPMVARSWDAKTQLAPVNRDQWVDGISIQCWFFTDGVKADVPASTPFDLFIQGHDVRNLFVYCSSPSNFWPDLTAVDSRSRDKEFASVWRGAKDVTTLQLNSLDAWLR